ncbi:hypothetical protein LUZ61_004765 [Rhynchospora tenuis]|uniref:KIB1-4 beta-propeller domain-containing protein n=1 Tax=Rhynchospora tenuis TaxID=198213 RepID=A0AAD5ZNB4_9POAL|nr:hypothetical protein LUZ61_004765 [Rhynchospora tenuis]
MQARIVSKAILSHDPKERSDFMAMIMFGEMNTPVFWRPGDVCWTVVDGQDSLSYDNTYFKGNFYVLSPVNELYVVDFDPKPKLRVVGPEIRVKGCVSEEYLIDFNGNLLLMERFCGFEETNLFTNGFNVIEPNLEENILYEWYDIDGYALFVGKNSSIYVNVSHFPTCKRNGIYFTHITDESRYACHDFGIYDMTDKKISKFYSLEVFPAPVVLPVWLTPNPW